MKVRTHKSFVRNSFSLLFFSSLLKVFSGILLIQVFIQPCDDIQAQTVNYEEEFSVSFPIALNKVASSSWMTDSMKKNGVDAALAWSIVFPEMIRYNSIQDFFEVSALQTLYIQFGDAYADFSIGWFQMKPSFAMRIQKKWMIEQKKYFDFPAIVFDTTDTPESRKKIVSLLNIESGQLMYLILFVKIMDFRGLAIDTPKEKTQLYATAYNSSFEYSKSTLKRLSAEKNFFTGMTRELSTAFYCYSDIALYFHEKYSGFVK